MLECKGYCELNPLPVNPVGKSVKHITPYLEHGYCRVCAYWFKKVDGWGKGRLHNRCPCCHGLYSTRPRLCKQRRMWRERTK